MFTQLWYITKFLQVSAVIGVGVGSMMFVGPRVSSPKGAIKARATLEKKEFRALPVKLPQGRLYCVKGVVMHERMYPRGFEPIAPADAVEIANTIAEEACSGSLRSSECKVAQGDLTSLRRAIRSCQG